MEEGAGPLPSKENHFLSQNDKFGCIFSYSVFNNAENTDSHQKPWDTDFTVQSRNEAYKNSAKIIQKNHGQAVVPSPISHPAKYVNGRISHRPLGLHLLVTLCLML